MLKYSQNKQDLIILDFDNTLYYNPDNNFDSEIKINNIIKPEIFFYELFIQLNLPSILKPNLILITGRDKDQKDKILHILNSKGFRFEKAIFNQMIKNFFPYKNEEINLLHFYLRYWEWKISLIEFYKQSNRYNNVIIVDDDLVICQMLQKFNFNVLQATIVKQNDCLNLTLKNRFNNS